jgi:predicted nucleic acid-binding protein
MAFTPIEEPQSSGFTPLKSSGFTPIQEDETLLEGGKQVLKNMAGAAKAGIGDVLSLANVIATTPEFITKVVSTPIQGLFSVGENAVQGKPPYIDWEKSNERASQLGETLFGPLNKAMPAVSKAMGLQKEYDTSLVNSGLEKIGQGIETAGKVVEEKTGIPAAGTAAVLETAMITGIPGAKAVVKRVVNNIKGLASTRRMDPGSEEWTSKKNDWVPTHTETGVPIVVGKLTEIDGTPAVDSSGRPAIARHYKNEDGTSKVINIDLEEAQKRFEEKPWTKMGYEEDYFKSPTDYAQFILRHEEEHTKLSFDDYKKLQDPNGDLFNDPEGLRSPEQLRKDYEQYINRQALDSLETSPYIGKPDVLVPKIPKDPTAHWQWLSDAFYSLGKGSEHDMTIAVNRRLAAKQDGVTPLMQQRWNDYAEGHGELDPHEKGLFDKYYADEQAERVKLIKYAQDKGWVLPTELDPSIAGENVARKVKSKKADILEKIKDALTGGKFGGFDPDIQAKPGAAMERSFFAGELATGKRVILQEQLKNTGETRIVQWNNGVATPFASGVKLKAGERIGSTKIKEARLSEIEKHTPYTYEKDTLGVLYQRLTELRDFVRANEFLTDMKSSDWFKENSVPIEKGTEIPEGFRRPKDIDKVPELDGYAFPDDIASIIEDFAKVNNPNGLTMLSGALIKNMMLNPLPHMMNEAWHLYNARGLTGWVSPPGIYRFAKSGMPALKSVLTQDQFYRDVLKEGGSIMSANVRNSAIMDGLFEKSLKEFAETPEFIEQAKAMGLSPAEAYNKLSKKSSVAMWTVRDMMYLQLIKEKMMYENMDMKEAIKDVERHMPSYRIPHKVMGSRGLSVALQNPNISVFSRYHYGLVNSIKETGVDLAAIGKGRAGVRQFLKGADTAAAIALAIAVLYPLQDQLASWLSGEKDSKLEVTLTGLESTGTAKQRRAGPYHIFKAMADVASNEKDPMAVMSSIFTFNPALLMLAQLGMDRKLYNGQPIYHPEDSGAKIAYDITKYVITQLPMASQAEQAQKAEDEGFKQWQMRQLDIEAPTQEQVMKREKQVNIRTKQGERRTMKWESDL